MRKVIIALIVLLILTLGIACSASSEHGREAAEVEGNVLDKIDQTIPSEMETAERQLAEPADAMDRIENAIRASLRR